MILMNPSVFGLLYSGPPVLGPISRAFLLFMFFHDYWEIVKEKFAPFVFEAYVKNCLIFSLISNIKDLFQK